MLLLINRIQKNLKIRKFKLIYYNNFSSCNYSDIYNKYENFLNIGNKKPDEIINLLNIINKEKRCDTELIKNITSHIYDFSDDFFCPQLIKVLENYVKLKYSDETLLGILCSRIDDIVSLKSCLRAKIMINIYKQLNFHHPLVKNPLLNLINENICHYKSELVSIIKNISYLHIDSFTSNNLINRIIVNYDYYDKDIFTIFESFSRLDEYNEAFVDLILKKIKKLEENDICCNFKNFLKFLSGYKRLGLTSNTYLHSQFEHKINNIKLLSPNNISYALLLMLSTKFQNESLFELLLINIENYVNNNNLEISEKKSLYFYDFSDNFFERKNKKENYFIEQRGNNKKRNTENNNDELIHHNNYESICNKYIFKYLPFHLLLLVLLNYDNKNIILHLLNICINEYIFFYDVSNLIKLLYSYTLLTVKNQVEKNEEIQKNIIIIFSALQNIYKSATISDYKILYDCFLYHQKIIEKNSKLKSMYDDLLYNECFSILPSSYSNLKFDEMEIIKCGSSSYLKDKDGTISIYLNKNDFFSSNDYKYDNLLLNVKFKIELLKNCNINNVKIIYKENILK
ncbi:conserved Plasmodium protein, unknown function [Plasmodium gallinaceum]|uniref:Uncharacterized protein n=1 Tax=Plasmodium gallinaceum TaxID=5849 RepID=A0A1J1GXZ7_PLAGA|nr:conserved Plasmodium protein, unknown function [Plasmodium gallinaceum]CRG95880.1 conserved Plasmodium protein, unknown function [Plasmodium gallinaceum]